VRYAPRKEHLPSARCQDVWASCGRVWCAQTARRSAAPKDGAFTRTGAITPHQRTERETNAKSHEGREGAQSWVQVCLTS
jgi:hypothetical protein